LQQNINIFMKLKLSTSIAIFAISMLFAACGGTAKTTTTPSSHNTIKGNWTLNKVYYTGLPEGKKIKITLLDEGNETCLLASTWVLPANGFGSYTIANSSAGCNPGERKINWSFRTENGNNIFQYKLLQEKVKAKNITDGYKFIVANVSNTEMELTSDVAFEGSTLTLHYYFTKQENK
jgi:Lipocalin-like domain